MFPFKFLLAANCGAMHVRLNAFAPVGSWLKPTVNSRLSSCTGKCIVLFVPDHLECFPDARSDQAACLRNGSGVLKCLNV
jgi:hypothetical protein